MKKNPVVNVEYGATVWQVLYAVAKLDSLRRHINDTQELLSNVDAMVQSHHPAVQQQRQQSQQDDDGGGSRTELLQQELGRLNSRLCCTVLALERAMSKALCRGTQSGAVATRSAADGLDYCCVSGQTLSGSAAQLPDKVASSSPSAGPPVNEVAPSRTRGICEQWLEQAVGPVPPARDGGPCPDSVDHPRPCQNDGGRRRRECADDEGPTLAQALPSSSSQQAQAGASSAPCQQQQQQENENREGVSLEDIHRMLGNIISDIDQPEKEQPTTAVDVASNPSLMTDSSVASMTDLQQPRTEEDRTSEHSHQLSHAVDTATNEARVEEETNNDDAPGLFHHETKFREEDCRLESNLFYCSSVGSVVERSLSAHSWTVM